jgi:SAM-dependent methyltransferase
MMPKRLFQKIAGQGPVIAATCLFPTVSVPRQAAGTRLGQRWDRARQNETAEQSRGFSTAALADPRASEITSDSMKILDVGCGANKYPGAVGLDYNEKTDADVIHDLGRFPYPFPDDEFDLVVSFHVIEHVPDVMGFVTELYRITKPGGRIRLVTPHYTNPDWASDPTHKNHFNSYSFDTFVPEKRNFKFYTDVNLRPIKRYAGLANLWKSLGIEWLVNLDHRSPGMRFIRQFWEHYLCTVLRGKEMDFEFEVVKGEQRQTV